MNFLLVLLLRVPRAKSFQRWFPLIYWGFNHIIYFICEKYNHFASNIFCNFDPFGSFSFNSSIISWKLSFLKFSKLDFSLKIYGTELWRRYYYVTLFTFLLFCFCPIVLDSYLFNIPFKQSWKSCLLVFWGTKA